MWCQGLLSKFPIKSFSVKYFLQLHFFTQHFCKVIQTYQQPFLCWFDLLNTVAHTRSFHSICPFPHSLFPPMIFEHQATRPIILLYPFHILSAFISSNRPPPCTCLPHAFNANIAWFSKAQKVIMPAFTSRTKRQEKYLLVDWTRMLKMMNSQTLNQMRSVKVPMWKKQTN